MEQSQDIGTLSQFVDILQEIYYQGLARRMYSSTGIPDANKGVVILTARATQGTSEYEFQNSIIHEVDRFIKDNQRDLEKIASQSYQGRLPSQETFVPEYTQTLMDLLGKESQLSKGLGSFCNNVCNRVLLSPEGALGLVAIQYFCKKVPDIEEIKNVAA
jgi:hypothetical protein